MPRVTLEWDDNGIQNNVAATGLAGDDTPLAEDGGPPALDDDSGTGTSVSDAQEDAGGPPAWLVEAIAGSPSGETARATGEDAGPAPA